MDVWDEEGSEPGQTAQIERDHNNRGYLDGVTRAKESSLQHGFDDGYPYGAEIGLAAGNIIGTLQGMGLADLEAAASKELGVAHLFSYEYYDKDTKALFEGTHPLISKWEKLVKGLQTEQPAQKLK